MIKKSFTVKNRLGIHARPAAMFAKEANQYACTIRVEKDGLDINGKSIMGIMMLAAGKGDTIHLKANGDGANVALSELEHLLMGDIDKNESVF